MTDRLVAAFAGLTLLVLALFAVPAAYTVADVVQDQQQQRTDRTAALVADAVADRTASGAGVDTAFLATLVRPGERIVYRDDAGRRLAVGRVADVGPTSTRPTEGGSVRVDRARASVSSQVSDHVLPLALLAVLLSVAAALLGVTAARRVTRPLGDLAEVAAEIGAGRFDTPVPRSGVREVDELGRALGDAARRLDRLVGRERALSVNASHELRTPLTALRLSLEDLSLWPQTAPEVRAELERAITEVDRLGDVVTGLLDERRDDARDDAVEVDLAAVAADVADHWRDRLGAQDRTLEVRTAAPVPGRVALDAVREVVDALLARAADSGRGTVTVDVGTTRTVLRVRVSDQGERRLPSGVLHGDSPTCPPDLVDAATTAESVGGYLAVQDDPRSRLLLILPRRR